MRTEQWQITLEAYLDGELSETERKAFEALAASDSLVGDELATRLDLRATWQGALGKDTAAPGIIRVAPQGRRRFSRPAVWLPAALAACLILAIGIPTLFSPGHRGAGSLTTAGQVAALRFGERPHVTVTLQTGVLELPAELSR